MELLIISGMSGAGKSGAANALEDIGFYCIDNMPPALIKNFAEIAVQSRELSRVAIVTDIRGGEHFKDVVSVLDSLKSCGIEYKVLFLDASDECLVRRYKETRRKHPVIKNDENMTVHEAVKREREILEAIRQHADFVVDTTYCSSSELKQRVTGIFLEDSNSGMTVQCVSFGFKYGSVAEADIVFDVRCLPNPYYVSNLRPLTGKDKDVVDYVFQFSQSNELAAKLIDLIDYSLPLYRNEGKTNLVIAVGCTGGKHRSVAFAEKIYKYIKSKGFKASVYHRDIKKDR